MIPATIIIAITITEVVLSTALPMDCVTYAALKGFPGSSLLPKLRSQYEFIENNFPAASYFGEGQDPESSYVGWAVTSSNGSVLDGVSRITITGKTSSDKNNRPYTTPTEINRGALREAIGAVEAAVHSKVHRVRIMKLKSSHGKTRPGKKMRWHRDSKDPLPQWRVHVPLVSPPLSRFEWLIPDRPETENELSCMGNCDLTASHSDKVSTHFSANGSAWLVRVDRRHRATLLRSQEHGQGGDRRVHLIMSLPKKAHLHLAENMIHVDTAHADQYCVALRSRQDSLEPYQHSEFFELIGDAVSFLWKQIAASQSNRLEIDSASRELLSSAERALKLVQSISPFGVTWDQWPDTNEPATLKEIVGDHMVYLSFRSRGRRLWHTWKHLAPRRRNVANRNDGIPNIWRAVHDGFTSASNGLVRQRFDSVDCVEMCFTHGHEKVSWDNTIPESSIHGNSLGPASISTNIWRGVRGIKLKWNSSTGYRQKFLSPTRVVAENLAHSAVIKRWLIEWGLWCKEPSNKASCGIKNLLEQHNIGVEVFKCVQLLHCQLGTLSRPKIEGTKTTKSTSIKASTKTLLLQRGQPRVTSPTELGEPISSVDVLQRGVSRKSVSRLAGLAAMWLSNSVQKQGLQKGRLVYKLWPSKSKGRGQESQNNNLIRQFMGSLALGHAARALASGIIEIPWEDAVGHVGRPENRSMLAGFRSPLNKIASRGEQDAQRFWHLMAANVDYNLRTFYHQVRAADPMNNSIFMKLSKLEPKSGSIHLPTPIHPGTAGIVEWQGKSKLGAVALAARAISSVPQQYVASQVNGTADWSKQAQGLRSTVNALWLAGGGKGAFRTWAIPADRNDNQNFYPGEALTLWAGDFAILAASLNAKNNVSNSEDNSTTIGVANASKGNEGAHMTIHVLLTRLLQSVVFYRGWHLGLHDLTDPPADAGVNKTDRNKNKWRRNPAFIPWHTMAISDVWHALAPYTDQKFSCEPQNASLLPQSPRSPSTSSCEMPTHRLEGAQKSSPDPLLDYQGPCIYPMFDARWVAATRDYLYNWLTEMNDWLLDMQEWGEPIANQSQRMKLFADIWGRFYDPKRPWFGAPHVSATGVYMESFAAAYKVVKAHQRESMGKVNGTKCDNCQSNDQRAKRYAQALKRACRSAIQLQFQTSEDLWYIAEESHRSLQGALRTTVYNNEVRVDNVQHVLAGSIEMIRAFDKYEEWQVSDSIL